jgi:hypothetical protein
MSAYALKSYRLLWFAAMFTSVLAWAQSPLRIENVTDKGVYNLGVWFRVPAESDYVYRVWLDGLPMPAEVTNQVDTVDYHEVLVSRTNVVSGDVTNRLVRFIVQSDRGNPEKGLIKWTPYPTINSTPAEFAGARLRLIAPAEYPTGLPIPIIAWVDDEQGRERRANGVLTAPGFAAYPIQVRRGVGSGFLPAATVAANLTYAGQLAGISAEAAVAVEPATTWKLVSGSIAGAELWPENSRIHLTANLTIAADAQLTIGAGSIIRLSPLVNLTNNGRVIINGTLAHPVVFTATNVIWPERFDGAWGGFVMRGASAQLIANGTIFAGGGGAANFGSFSPGASHRTEQPVLLLHSGAKAALTNCCILNTAGQVANGYNCEFLVDHCLFQRAITAGEYAGSSSVVVINHSALLEFPVADGVIDAKIADADYDGIYFTEGTHILMNSLFGFAKDDAIDSGSGGTGTMWVSNCWVESALHEAHAWSGGGRTTWSYDSVLMNCGQGIECGWSTGSDSPMCYAERMLSLGNSVGARIGDNYDWNYTGFLNVSNSVILHNYRDIFLKTWNAVKTGWDTNSWIDRRAQANFVNNYFTAPDPCFPDNQAWNAASDAGMLAHWMSTPPSAPVGVGLAVWTNQFALDQLFAGVPVRLSTFTTNAVAVDYGFEDAGGSLLSAGTLLFAPGETVKRFYPAGFDVRQYPQVRAVLRAVIAGELTGTTEATFSGVLPPVTVSLAVITNQFAGARLAEGVWGRLSAPASVPISFDYQFEASDHTLQQTGTLVFSPGETLGHIIASNVSVIDFDWTDLKVSGPVNATWVGPSKISFGNPPLVMRLGVTNQQPLLVLSDGIPVVLSAPASKTVSVDFRFQDANGMLTNGTVVFKPGETSQLILAPSLNPTYLKLVKLSLSNARGAPLPDVSSAFFTRMAINPPPHVTVIPRDSTWRYWDAGDYPGDAWTTLDFDDSAWGAGAAPLGYGADQTTSVGYGTNSSNKHLTTWFRRTFVISTPEMITNLTFNLRRDDGAVVYLDGAELYRENMPTGLINPATTATTNVGGTSTVITSRSIPIFTLGHPLMDRTNLVAVEIHQNNGGSSDLLMQLEVVADLTPPLVDFHEFYWGRFDGQLVVAWGDPTNALLEADEINGTWRMASNVSPVVIIPSAQQRYYRLQNF